MAGGDRQGTDMDTITVTVMVTTVAIEVVTGPVTTQASDPPDLPPTPADS